MIARRALTKKSLQNNHAQPFFCFEEFISHVSLSLNQKGMISKEKLKKHIEKFPDVMSIDDLIDKLVFVEKLENRISQSIKGETITEEDLKTEMEKWFK